MKPLIIIFLIINLFGKIGFSQNEYYLIDNKTVAGIEIVRGSDISNSEFCRVKINESKIEKFSADVVHEYGLKNGRVYISKKIKTPSSEKHVFLSKKIKTPSSEKYVFLERLVDDKTSLFYYKENGFETYFIELENSEFHEIPKEVKETGIEVNHISMCTI